MNQKISQTLDDLSEFLARRKGLLPIVGILFILINLILQFFPGVGWFVQANLFLHVGLILSLIGFMLAWAL
jgi:hypothetical protein